jgi:AcrR family transcriptional regulator
MENVAERARLARSTLYRRFGNKREQLGGGRGFLAEQLRRSPGPPIPLLHVPAPNGQ